jgi:hypothetical protein
MGLSLNDPTSTRPQCQGTLRQAQLDRSYRRPLCLYVCSRQEGLPNL